MIRPVKYSLLILDDDDLILNYLHEIFAEKYNILAFKNPLEALSHLRAQKPRVDLVIADQKMPRMTGIEFLREMSKLYPRVIKIILTGHPKTGDLIEAINSLEVFRYVTKPADPAYLSQEVEEALRRSEALQQVGLDQVGDAIVVVNQTGQIESINKAGERLFGHASNEVIGKNFKLLFYEPRQDKYDEYFDTFRANKDYFRPLLKESTGLRKDGSTVPLDLAITQGNIGDDVLYIICARSAQKRRLSEEQSRFQAYHDPLTGLPNRKLFVDRLSMAIANAGRQRENLAVVSMNLDRFQIINNTLGFTAGDQVLEKVARMIIKSAREGDTVARFAADEFAVLLNHVRGAEDAARFAQRVMEMLNVPLMAANRELYLACSMGISLYPSDGGDPETLIANANTAMAAAKKSEGNSYQLFNPDLNMMALDRLVFESGLRKAIERDEFFLNFQPIVDSRSLKIRAAEALIRWKHPDLGLVSPSNFIPVAEETGFISAIGEWVLRAACLQNKAWHEKGYEKLPVAVNVSSRQFREDRFVESVRNVLDETGLDPCYLELEVTETLMMDNVESSIKKLQGLKDLGIMLCIDDFGTGYSSFSYLKRFPIDVLKIDQSFVRDLTHNSKDAAIASAIIDIAHRLKLEVVAEGVETKEQLAFLRSQSCDKLQGFLFSPPLPPDLLFSRHAAAWEALLDETNIR